RVADLRTIGRATQGVRLLKISERDEISSVAKVAAEEKDVDGELTEETPNGVGPDAASDVSALTDPEALSAN
ncbi:MAG TPA: DNA gyrase C-terminal beta-propeller domain-containing protein, partial [Hymenobacter sp.]